MRIRTKVFELQAERGWSVRELARRMGISDAQVVRVRNGQRGISRSFMEGALRAFPGSTLDDLFPADAESESVA